MKKVDTYLNEKFNKLSVGSKLYTADPQWEDKFEMKIRSWTVIAISKDFVMARMNALPESSPLPFVKSELNYTWDTSERDMKLTFCTRVLVFIAG